MVQAPIPFICFASQVRGKHCRGRALQGRPLFNPEQQPPSLSHAAQWGGKEEADGQTGGQDRWQDRWPGQTRRGQTSTSPSVSPVMEHSPAMVWGVPGPAYHPPPSPAAVPGHELVSKHWLLRQTTPRARPPQYSAEESLPDLSRPQVGSDWTEPRLLRGEGRGLGPAQPWASLWPAFQ